MIWGMTLEPGKLYTETIGEEVQLSMATIDSRKENGDGTTNSFSQIVMQTSKGEYVLCTLIHGVMFQQNLDLKIMPREKVTFSVEGPSVVCLVGYTASYPEDEENSESMREEELDASEDSAAWEAFELEGSKVPHIKEEPIEVPSDQPTDGQGDPTQQEGEEILTNQEQQALSQQRQSPAEPIEGGEQEEEHIIFSVAENKTCRVWGVGHQKTFDNYGISFHTEAQFITLTICKDNNGSLPQFRVIQDFSKEQPSRPNAYIRAFILEYNGTVYSIAHQNVSRVDGITVTLPYSDGNGVRIHYAAPHQTITTDFGLVIRLDAGHNGGVTLPVSFMDKVCGLCGNYDDIRGNECHYRNGTSMRRDHGDCKNPFLEEWQHRIAETTLYPEHMRDSRPCSDGSSLLAEARKKCGILTNSTGPLASCHEYAPPDLFYENCVLDLCQTLPSTSFLCGGIESYIYECGVLSGGEVTAGKWREAAPECGLTCGENMVFAPRGYPCPPTCANPEGTPPDECPMTFLESCQCVEGMVLDGTKCVPVEECGCKMGDGRYVSVGDGFMNSDCTQTCICDAVLGLQCSSVACSDQSVCAVKFGVRDCYCEEGYTGHGREECTTAPRTCRIFGDPNVITFDDHYYSHQGVCAYTVVHTCKPLPEGVPLFRIFVKLEKLIPEETYSSITVVRLQQDGKNYRIHYKGKVTVDGEHIGDTLPFVDSEAGVQINKTGSSYVLSTEVGLEIAINGTNEMTVTLPTVYQGNVCGLCGNADGNDANDQMMPDETMAEKIPFANSWTRSGSQCTSLDEPVENCEAGTDEYADAVDSCSVLIKKDGPFAHCHDYQDPGNYFRSCVFDLCGTLPDKAFLCSSVTQYVQACEEKGGLVGDWTGGVPLCAPISCPTGYSPHRQSCYKFSYAKKNFEESKSFCEAEGGHLATVHSRAENDFVSKISRRMVTWLGAKRNQSASFRTVESSGENSYTFLLERIPRSVGSIRVSTSAESGAYIILSPTLEPNENTKLYEIALGTTSNRTDSLRLCMDCPEVVSSTGTILRADRENRFYVNFRGGKISVGRRRDVSLFFKDPNPFRVKYIGFKNIGDPASWNFYADEFSWVTGEGWGYDSFRFGEPNNFNSKEDCLQTNFNSETGLWNDQACDRLNSFVCEIEQ